MEIVAGLMSTGFEVGISWAYARKSFVPCRAPVGLPPCPLLRPIGVPSVSLELDRGGGGNLQLSSQKGIFINHPIKKNTTHRVSPQLGRVLLKECC